MKPGSTQEFTVVIPVTAQSSPVVGLTLTAPAGTRILDAASSPPRWTATLNGGTVTWRGGPIAPGSFDSFGFRARLPSRPGSVAFSARELYGDGPAPAFKLDVVLFGGETAATESDDGTRTLAIFALAIAIVAVVLAAGALVVSLARWLRG